MCSGGAYLAYLKAFRTFSRLTSGLTSASRLLCRLLRKGNLFHLKMHLFLLFTYSKPRLRGGHLECFL